MGWFNWYGLAVMAIIMIPNIVYAVNKKNAANSDCNKAVVIAEQTGRYGCFVLMIFNIPYTYFNFWFDNALTVYLSVNGALCIAYIVFWAVCWSKNGKLKALSLSVLPACIFLFSGTVLANIPLIVFAVIFGASHIYISYKNIAVQTVLRLHIYEVKNKKDFMPLLLLGDEQESMILKYLDRGTMYVLDDGGVKGEIVVTPVGKDTLEIKNLAVLPEFQKRGYGRKLIEFICESYRTKYETLQVGTGDSPLTVPFYEKCGFAKSHTVKNFFTDNYDHPVIENGKQLADMIYLQRKLH